VTPEQGRVTETTWRQATAHQGATEELTWQLQGSTLQLQSRQASDSQSLALTQNHALRQKPHGFSDVAGCIPNTKPNVAGYPVISRAHSRRNGGSDGRTTIMHVHVWHLRAGFVWFEIGWDRAGPVDRDGS
jgi:hypothetical protein